MMRKRRYRTAVSPCRPPVFERASNRIRSRRSIRSLLPHERRQREEAQHGADCKRKVKVLCAEAGREMREHLNAENRDREPDAVRDRQGGADELLRRILSIERGKLS